MGDFKQTNTACQKIQINQKADAIPVFLGGENKKTDIKPRGYNEYTKRFDANFNKLGLRK